MKKTIMLTAPLLVLAYYGTSQVTTAQGQCEKPPGDPPMCQPGRQVTITNGPNIVAPPNLCIAAGATVTFNVQQPGTTASIDPKEGDWPIGDGESWELVVPHGKPYYDYNVHFEDGSCLDPRITISQ
jgi:hypothetical protein